MKRLGVLVSGLTGQQPFSIAPDLTSLLSQSFVDTVPFWGGVFLNGAGMGAFSHRNV